MKIFSLPVLLLLLSLQLPAQIDLQLNLVSDAFGGVVDITHAGDGRLFVVEKSGRIRILQPNGNINATPFLDISTQVSTNGERGLLGLTFHPDYAQNGYFFVNYTNTEGNTVIARFEVSANNPAVADPASEIVLFTIDQPDTNHNGGDLNFGPDGYLYISTGDGGGAGDPGDNAQDPTTMLGKVLRIDVDNDNTGSDYAIPADNPLADGTGSNADEIWALGLRNPWRFSFDRLTGDMWIGDVGQEQREEINFEAAGSPGGLNYGWRCYEGELPYNTADCSPASSYTPPRYAYGHDVGCSVNGGYVYRGEDFPSLYGLYLYSDFCTGRIWSLQNIEGEWVNEELFQNSGGQFVTMGEDYRGELYLGSLNGSVYRIVDAACLGAYPNMNIDDNAIATGTYQAGEMLTSSGTVEGGASVTFMATGTIVLEPGFLVDAESDFLALIDPCPPAANSIAALPQTAVPATPQSTLEMKLLPNPTRSEATIRYILPETTEVDIHIWDIHGRVVARPVSNQRQEAGVYDRSFSAAGLPSGIYQVMIRAGGQQQTERLEIIR